MTKEETIEMFKKYLNSPYKSLTAFGIHKAGISGVTLTRHFREHIVGYEEITTQKVLINTKEKLKELV